MTEHSSEDYRPSDGVSAESKVVFLTYCKWGLSSRKHFSEK